MTLASYLTLSRHNIYYYRFPIPKDLHPEHKNNTQQGFEVFLARKWTV